MADRVKQLPQPDVQDLPDLWDQLFAQALKIQPPGLHPAGSQPTGLQPAVDGIPQAENIPDKKSGDSLYIQDAEVLAARNSASAMHLLWDRVAPLVRGMVDITLNHHRHVRKEDLQQEAWIAFAQSVERYDGRSRGAYWTYLRLSLHTRFR